MIGDDKITYSRTSMSNQTVRKKHSTCHQNEGVRGCTCSASVYKAASSLAECKTGCAIPVFINVLGPFELKKFRFCFNICLRSTATLPSVKGDSFSSPDMWPLGQKVAAPRRRALQHLGKKTRSKSKSKVHVVNRCLHRKPLIHVSL